MTFNSNVTSGKWPGTIAEAAELDRIKRDNKYCECVDTTWQGVVECPYCRYMRGEKDATFTKRLVFERRLFMPRRDELANRSYGYDAVWSNQCMCNGVCG